jgi:hypothetical protein
MSLISTNGKLLCFDYTDYIGVYEKNEIIDADT